MNRDKKSCQRKGLFQRKSTETYFLCSATAGRLQLSFLPLLLFLNRPQGWQSLFIYESQRTLQRSKSTPAVALVHNFLIHLDFGLTFIYNLPNYELGI